MDINRYSPSYGINHRHMDKISDYSTEEIFEILYATKVMKGKFIAHEETRILRGVTVALLFGDTSLRTRSALEIGIRQLGGTCIYLPYSREDMRASENIKDVVNVISRYGVGALITRGIDSKELNGFCAVSEIPVINSVNDLCAPVQALCDLFTIWEKREKLEGLKLAYVGKSSSIAASVLTCAVKCGLTVAAATPKEFAIDSVYLDDARQYGNITVTENPVEAVKDADIVYTDNYGYHNVLSKTERDIFLPYQVNNTLFGFSKRNALFMHPLPANRGIEVTPDIIDGKNSIVLDQAENKLHTLKAVLAMLV